MKEKKIKLIVVIILLCYVITPFVLGKYSSKFDDKTITLNVTKPYYTVVFHSNYDSDVTETQDFIYGTAQTLRPNSFTRVNYVFMGWNTKPDGSGFNYSDEESVNKLSPYNNGVVDLYAVWREELTFSVVGNANNWTNQNVTLTIVPDVPGTYEYSFDGGVSWQNLASFTFFNNQVVYMKMRELDGFSSGVVSETINKIDKVSPTISYDNDIEYNSDHSIKLAPTLITTLGINTNLITGVNTNDDLSGANNSSFSCYYNNNIINSTNVFTNVGRYEIECRVEDNAGNIGTENREVLVRWPTGGKYVVKKTEIDGDGIVATGLSSSTMDDGLYKDNASTGGITSLPYASKYYYTGPNVSNYINFANSTFRILNVSSNDNIKLLGDVSDKKVRWGSGLQTNNRKIYESVLFNTWSSEWWPNGQIYNNESGESKYKVFTDEEKAHIPLATFYAGRFNKADAVDISYTVFYEQTGGVNLGGENDTNAAFEGYSAFPNVSDYLKASKAHDVVINIDDTQDDGALGIGLTKREVFNNNSWIDMSIDQWTMNSKNLTNTDNDFWVVDGTLKGRIMSRTFYYEQQYRVVFYLTSSTILSGDGSQDSPYNVEEDWAWFDSNQVLQ